MFFQAFFWPLWSERPIPSVFSITILCFILDHLLFRSLIFKHFIHLNIFHVRSKRRKRDIGITIFPLFSLGHFEPPPHLTTQIATPFFSDIHSFIHFLELLRSVVALDILSQ